MGTSSRGPALGHLEFSVSEDAAGPTELWKILAVVLILAISIALLSLKRKN